MVLVDEIKGLMAKYNISQKEMARRIGIHEHTLSRRLHKGVLTSKDIEVLIKELHITNPACIFFANAVASEETNQR